MFIFHWMRHCIPIQQKQTVKIRAAIPKKYWQSTGTYSSLLYIGKPTREPSEHYLAVTDDTVKHPVTNWGNMMTYKVVTFLVTIITPPLMSQIGC